MRALRALRADLRLGIDSGESDSEFSAIDVADMAAPSNVRARAMLAETEPTLTDDAFAISEAAPFEHPDIDWHPWR